MPTIRTIRSRLAVRRRFRTLCSRWRTRLGLPNPKVFCIGRNKTGTTSLERALKDLGFRLGSQRAGELLMEDWGRRDFRSIIDLVHTADAFQDVPFSNDYTYQALDAAFPGSKFILTIRNSPEQWYESVIRFTKKRLGLDRLPTPDDLRGDPYVYPGWSWRNVELVWGDEAEDCFGRERRIRHYIRHNRRVKDYFKHRPGDLLVLNVADADAMERLCVFLGVEYRGQAMPELNVTRGAERTSSAGSGLQAT
jgi:hypothetical protein